MQKKLSALAVGQKAIICSLEDEELVLKLMEMGFLPGEEITVEQIAPLGDPISVMVAGYQVSLRISEADTIMVEIKQSQIIDFHLLMKIGLYFGSFNPIHNGHLIIATHILQNTTLDQIWFVVSPQNPFKQSGTLLNEYHRLHLVQQAIEGETKLKASDIEFSLPRPSYTIDTLTYLEEKYPENSFSVIMGSDSYQNIAKWKSGEVLQKRYPILVYLRPGFSIAEDAAKKATILNAPMLDISSTIIRKMVAAGQSIRYMVPETVNEEILKSGYYK